MLIIHRVISPEKAKRIRSIWERMGAVEAESKREAISIEREGKFLVFVDETDDGQNCLSQKERRKLFDLKRLNKWPETYEARYIQPRVKHLCGESEAWYELRVAVAEENISIDDVFRMGPFRTRTEKDGFLTGTIPEIIDRYEPLGCHCNKAVMVGKIEKLIELEETQQEVGIQTDSRYANLQQLLGLKVPEPSCLS